MQKTLHTVLFVLICAIGLQAQDLIRGPYQQSLAQTSVKIMWSTSTPTTGWVKVGSSPDNLTTVVSESAPATDHIVLVSGLNAASKYYYAVGYDETTLAGGDELHHIKTAHLYGDTTGFSFWAIGDFGKANVEQRDTRIAFENYNLSNPVDFGLMLGDHAYQDGTQEEYQKKVFDQDYAYDSLMRFIQFYPTPGNHDYNSVNRLEAPEVHRGPYFDIFEVFKNGEAGGVPSGTELYYSFDYGNAHFISINSELFQWTGLPNSKMEQWLKQDLAANKQPWTIVLFHQPPYSSGSHLSDDFWEVFMKNMRERFNPILEAGGVDLVLCGHSHVYERSFLANGHYTRSGVFDPAIHIVQNTSGNPDKGESYVKTIGSVGTIYNVVGNSGSSTSEDDIPPRIHPIFAYNHGGRSVCGSLVVEVKGSTLTGTYITSKGEILDKYQIFKQLPVSTSVKENYAQKIGLKAYPNPSSDVLNLSFTGAKAAKGSLIISDMAGKQVAAQTVQVNEGNMVVPVINWKKLPSGSYIVSLEFNNQPASIAVVKAK